MGELSQGGTSWIELPQALLEYKAPPKIGDGVVAADFDAETQTGLIRYVGIITAGSGSQPAIHWRPLRAEIWVDTALGRRFWTTQPGFCFAERRVAGYGLHEMFAEQFGLQPRSTAAAQQPRVRAPRPARIPSERLVPLEVIGEATDAPRGGYVYVLKSAYGFKIGRTRSIPDRMRTFGVKLPFVYSIYLCAWFDDHIAAESAYHRQFANKRINGEWFDVSEHDIAQIRARALIEASL